MHLMAFYIDGREGTRRTNILTGTAADTGRLVDSGNQGRLLIVLVERHHLDGSRRTVAGTVAALHLISQHYTVLLNPNSMPNLNRTLLYIVEWLDGSRRTDLRTACTLRTAVTFLIRHGGLHQM